MKPDVRWITGSEIWWAGDSMRKLVERSIETRSRLVHVGRSYRDAAVFLVEGRKVLGFTSPQLAKWHNSWPVGRRGLRRFNIEDAKALTIVFGKVARPYFDRRYGEPMVERACAYLDLVMDYLLGRPVDELAVSIYNLERFRGQREVEHALREG